ncbi:MAG TPA: hypothetical protein VIM61_01385 [Chthoniobacterales bacterium]
MITREDDSGWRDRARAEFDGWLQSLPATERERLRAKGIKDFDGLKVGFDCVREGDDRDVDEVVSSLIARAEGYDFQEKFFETLGEGSRDAEDERADGLRFAIVELAESEPGEGYAKLLALAVASKWGVADGFDRKWAESAVRVPPERFDRLEKFWREHLDFADRRKVAVLHRLLDELIPGGCSQTKIVALDIATGGWLRGNGEIVSIAARRLGVSRQALSKAVRGWRERLGECAGYFRTKSDSAIEGFRQAQLKNGWRLRGINEGRDGARLS